MTIEELMSRFPKEYPLLKEAANRVRKLRKMVKWYSFSSEELKIIASELEILRTRVKKKKSNALVESTEEIL